MPEEPFNNSDLNESTLGEGEEDTHGAGVASSSQRESKSETGEEFDEMEKNNGPTLEDEIFGDESSSSLPEDEGGRDRKLNQGNRTRNNNSSKRKARKGSFHTKKGSTDLPIDKGTTKSQISERVLEARREFDEALEKIKSQGNRRRKAYEPTDPIDLDELASKLRRRMEDAAIEDNESIENGQAALAKHKLLSTALEMLNKKHLHEVLLDAGILSAIRLWLEPLPNRILPADRLRKSLLDVLKLMPIETDHLRESGIGRIVMFFARRAQETPEIQRLAKELVARWSRPLVAGTRATGTTRMEDEEEEEERIIEKSISSRTLHSAQLVEKELRGGMGPLEGELSGTRKKLMQHLLQKKTKSKRTM